MSWTTPTKLLSPASGSCAWLPRWEVVVIHERPDGTTTGVDGSPGRVWFEDRHTDPRTPSFDWTTRVDRDSPGRDIDPRGCAVSAAALVRRPAPSRDPMATAWEEHQIVGGEIHRDGDGLTPHQRDWDFLAGWLAAERQRQGVGSGATQRDILAVIAGLANSRRGLTHPSRHPADVALHSSFCVGGGNLVAGLSHVAGIPARVLHTATHTMCEVWVDGGWHLVDTFDSVTRNKWKADPHGGDPREVFDHGLLQLALDPAIMPPGIPRDQVIRYHEEQPLTEPWVSAVTRNWQFGQCALGHERTYDPVIDGNAMMVQPGPATVRAVYPEWQHPRHLARDGAETELVLNPRQGWCQVACGVDRGMAIRQEFWLGGLDDGNPVRGVRMDLHLVDSFGCGFNPRRAGWELAVNGSSVPLDPRAWELRGAVLSIHVPLALLTENSVNAVTLGSSRPYGWTPDYRMPDMLWFWTFPDVLGTAAPWHEIGERQQLLPLFEKCLVQGNHTAYLVAPWAI